MLPRFDLPSVTLVSLFFLRTFRTLFRNVSLYVIRVEIRPAFRTSSTDIEVNGNGGGKRDGRERGRKNESRTRRRKDE